MIRNIGDGRGVDGRTTFAITTAWLVGVIMAATYMNVRDAGALATVASATSTDRGRIVGAYDPSTDPTVIADLRTLHARHVATTSKRYGCLALPTTIATASLGSITFACPVGVAYKTLLHGRIARRTHIGIARTIALHPRVVLPGDSVRYELVPPR